MALFTKDSTFTEEDALNLGREVSKKAMKNAVQYNQCN